MIDPRRIWSSTQLPTLPTVAIRLLELSRDPESEVRDYVEVIKTDPAISAKILKSTNSSFFGIGKQVTSVDRAVPLLGTTVVTSLALSFSLVESAMGGGPLAEHFKAYWKESVVMAVSCEVAGQIEGERCNNEFFLAGLLCDLGRLAMLKTCPKDYLRVLEHQAESSAPLHVLEMRHLGFDHVLIGDKLMENWSLPTAIREAARRHHASLDEILAVSEHSAYPLIQAAAIGAATSEYFCAEQKGGALQRLRELTDAFHKFDEERLQQFLGKVKVRIDEAAELFSIEAADILDPADIMAMASEQLAMLAVREHVASTQARAMQTQAEKEKTELLSQNIQLQKQALHDSLTKIYNRQFFDEAIKNEIERCSRSATTVGLIFCDVDHFKKINDTYGHSFGDVVLQRVAIALGQVLRKSDVLARYGGEEFVALIHQPSDKSLEKIAERIRAKVESLEFTLAGKPIKVSVSVGASIALPRRNDLGLAERLINSADEAMYDSKRNGRNQVHCRSLISDQDRMLIQMTAASRFSRWLVSRQEIDVAAATRALLQGHACSIRLGELGIERGLLTPDQVEQIRVDQQSNGERFGETALRFGFLELPQVAYLLALQQEDPDAVAAALSRAGDIDSSRLTRLREEYRREHESSGSNSSRGKDHLVRA